MADVMVLFVEGETDLVFYNEVIELIRSRSCTGLFHCNIEKKNLKGIGNFKNKLMRKFNNDIIPKFKDQNIVVFLCYDTDVFGFHNSPKIDWLQIKRQLLESGANKVHFIKAEKCIEDWFLIDKEGICRFLRLDENTRLKGMNGVEKMENLFKKANKVYVKGKSVNGLIQTLDIEKIVLGKIEIFRPIYKILGITDDNLN